MSIQMNRPTLVLAVLTPVVTLMLWGAVPALALDLEVAIITNPDPVLEEIAAEHMRQNPDVTILYEWGQKDENLLLRVAGGTPPDIYVETLDAVYHPARNGLLLPLDDLIRKSGFPIEDLFPRALDPLTLGGRLYGVPMTWGPTVAAYNRNMLFEVGLGDPDPDWTWNDWLEMGQKVTRDENGDGTPDVWLSRLNWRIVDWPNEIVYAAGGFFASQDLAEWGGNRPETIEALQFVADATNEFHILPTPGETQALGLRGVRGAGLWHAGGKIALEIITPDMLRANWENNGFDWDLVESPVYPRTGRRGSRYQAWAWAIVKDSPNIDAAWDYITFVNSEESQAKMVRAGGGIASRRDVALQVFVDPSTPQKEEAFVAAAEYMRFTYYFLWQGDAETILRDAVTRIMEGQISAKAAMEEITPTIEGELRAMQRE